jgi:hypothetical protein
MLGLERASGTGQVVEGIALEERLACPIWVPGWSAYGARAADRSTKHHDLVPKPSDPG